MSETVKYAVVAIICGVASAAGIIASAVHCSPLDGGRGGAIAVGVALVMMVMSRDYGSLPLAAVLSHLSWIRRRLKRSGSDAAHSDIEKRLEQVEGEVLAISKAMSASQAITDRDTKWQNKFLAGSSAVGTAAWGFGDWAAQWLMTHYTSCPPPH